MTGSHPPVHGIFAAAAVAGLLGGEEEHKLGHLHRLGEPTERDRRWGEAFGDAHARAVILAGNKVMAERCKVGRGRGPAFERTSCSILVLMSPGCTLLHRIPCGPSPSAPLFVMPRIAHLLAP